MSVHETEAATALDTLNTLEATLMILFDQQQKLSSGALPFSMECSLRASQVQLMREMYAEVKAARLAVWSLVVPTIEEVIEEPTVMYCEPVNEEQEEEED